MGCLAQILRYERLDGCLEVYVRTHNAQEEKKYGWATYHDVSASKRFRVMNVSLRMSTTGYLMSQNGSDVGHVRHIYEARSVSVIFTPIFVCDSTKVVVHIEMIVGFWCATVKGPILRSSKFWIGTRSEEVFCEWRIVGYHGVGRSVEGS